MTPEDDYVTRRRRHDEQEEFGRSRAAPAVSCGHGLRPGDCTHLHRWTSQAVRSFPDPSGCRRKSVVQVQDKKNGARFVGEQLRFRAEHVSRGALWVFFLAMQIFF